MRESLEADLANAWVAELCQWWSHYNREYLNSALRRPQIALLDTERTIGHWNPATRELGIASDHIRSASWHTVLETLRHEMAHQYVSEAIGATESPHGPAFRAACKKLRVSPRATAAGTKADASEDPSRTRLLRRIEKLLSLADSPNENEATAAFQKARRLMIEHNLQLEPTQDDFEVRELGAVRARHHAWEFVLANILDEFFFVDVIWAHSFDAASARRGTVLRAFGTAANLDMAGYVHDFLTALMERLWEDYREREAIAGNRDRLRYFHGAVLGFQAKLGEQRIDADVHDQALIPVHDAALREFFAYHNPRTKIVARGAAHDSAARRAGNLAGRSITIHKPLRSERGGFGGYLG